VNGIIGSLRNSKPLDYADESFYKLEVKAEDCGGRISENVDVIVEVKPICKPGWTGTAYISTYKNGI